MPRSVALVLLVPLVLATFANAGLGQPAWGPVTRDGFGDATNLALFGTATHEGDLYIGTFNESGGQVWRYDAGTGSCTQDDVAGLDSNNGALFLGPAYQGDLYMGTYNEVQGCEVWKKSTGKWSSVATGGFGSADNIEITGMGVFGGALYAGTQNLVTGTEVWKYDGSSWASVSTSGFGDANNVEANGFVEHGGRLYCGVSNESTGCEVWRYDGSAWQRVDDRRGPSGEGGFGAPRCQSHARAIVVHAGSLFVGTENDCNGCEVWTSIDGTTWTPASTSGLGDPSNNEVISLAVFANKLFAGIERSDEGTGARVWKYDGEQAWSFVSAPGFGDVGNSATLRLAGHESALYASTGNENGGQMWSTATSPCRRSRVAGTPADVLRVNASTGDAQHVIRIGVREPLQIDMAAPPSGPMSAKFALWLWADEEPDACMAVPLPRKLGPVCFPFLALGGQPQPFKVWNNLGHERALGEPDFPSTPAPSIVLNAPGGSPRAATVTMQGVIEDDGSAAGTPHSITNALILKIR